MKRLSPVICIGLFSTLVLGFPEAMDTILDELSRELRFASENGGFRARLSGTLDLEYYAFDGSPPGLIRTADDWLLNPRLTLFLDGQAGPALYGFAQARLDRGFDPADRDAELRLDEYALRLTPWEDGRLSLQAGQFATVVGQWVVRHLSWDNTFVTAPLLYEAPTRLSDLGPLPSASYLTYPSGRESYYYNPVIWGPSYATGFAASGKLDPLEWAVEVKNGSLMSRPEFWSILETGFDAPTISGRIAWRPDLRWTVGLSASGGSYAGPEGAFGDRGDFDQRLYMLDVSFEHRHLQVWAEIAQFSFTAPMLDEDLDVVTWFIEANYKLFPRLSVAARWNEQEYSEIEYYGDDIGKWGNGLERLDLAVRWRFNAHSQMVFQLDHYWRGKAEGDRFVFSSRMTLRF